MAFLKKIIPYILIILILLSVFVVWKTNPVKYQMYSTETISFVRAKVTAVNSQTLEDSTDLPGRQRGVQNISVTFTEGKKKGEGVTFDNMISDTHNVLVDVGTRIIVKCDEPQGVAPYYSVYQYDRTMGLALAFLFFFALICIVGKTKGIKSALALFVSVVVIAGAMLPAIYNGKSPVLVTFLVCLAISSLTLVLLNGFSAKTGVAVLSTLIGLLASAVFYFVIAEILTVTGYSMEETEELILISRSTSLKISEVLFSGILLGSLGAVMDTSMSIAAALFEMLEVSGKMKKKELFASGMNIGRDMIGTMCQTLVLAFTGGSVAFFLVTLSYGTRFTQFLSSDFLALEVLQALTGSFAVVLTVPITAFLSSVLAKKVIK